MFFSEYSAIYNESQKIVWDKIFNIFFADSESAIKNRVFLKLHPISLGDIFGYCWIELRKNQIGVFLNFLHIFEIIRGWYGWSGTYDISKNLVCPGSNRINPQNFKGKSQIFANTNFFLGVNSYVGYYNRYVFISDVVIADICVYIEIRSKYLDLCRYNGLIVTTNVAINEI